ncbi:MAG: DUF5615 family PIN-like protein [Planctomycetes bacterium]|nr:DUF5615 family PIN-like protein [Planctomycetota bacterium]
MGLLRGAGFEACHALDQQLGGQPDHVLAEACRAELRAIVTLDLDFADLRAFPPDRFRGILVLRLRSQDTESVLSAFRKLLPSLTEETVVGKLLVISESSVRVRGRSD